LKSLLATLFRLSPLPLARWVIRLANTRFNITVVGVFFARDGRVLVLRHVFRRRYPWGLPAGFLVAGETPEAAAVREVKEETGLDVRVQRILAVHPVLPRMMEVVVVGRVDSSQAITPSHEIFEGEFCAPDALPDELMPSHREWVRRAGAPSPALSTEA